MTNGDPTNAADYRERAEQHKPPDREALRAEVVRLMREQQMTIRDVGRLFHLADADLLQLINEPAGEKPR